MHFVIATAPLSKDEKAWSLYEVEMYVTVAGNRQELHRVQTVRVVRDGRLVEFSRDLGPASKWAAGPLTVISLGEDSVGQAMDLADYQRGPSQKDLKRAMDDHLASRNIIQEAITRAEQMQKFMRENPRTIDALHRTAPKTDKPGRTRK